MPSNISTARGVLSADLVTGGTVTVTYPKGTTRGDFVIGMRHRLSVIGKQFSCPELITVVLGATAAVITYNGLTTIPAYSPFTVELDRNTTNNPLATSQLGADSFIKPGLFTGMFPTPMVFISLGTPTVAAATSVCAAQAVAAAGAAIVNGTKLVGVVAPLGAPTGRNVVVASTNAGDTTQLVTVTGTDMYGQVMRQNFALAGAATITGTKAFATVTGVSVSAALAGNLTVGDGAVLGLPAYLSNSVFVLKEIQDGAAATAGVIVLGLGITTAATLLNGDVRGTYAPNSAPDGTRAYALLTALPETSFYGQPQA